MRRRLLFVALASAMVWEVGAAQPVLPGSYSGFFTSSSDARRQPRSVTLEIVSIENGQVIGKLLLALPSGHCGGEFAVVGKYADGVLQLRARRDEGLCRTQRLSLTVEGGKLSGTIGDEPVTLSK